MKRVLLVFLFLTFENTQASVPLIKRTELFSFLEKKICKNNRQDLSLTPSELWANGIYDSQVLISILTPEKKGALSKENLDIAAKIQMTKESHRSFIYGKCGNRFAWLATLPSPVSIDSENLETELTENCKSFEIETVPNLDIKNLNELRTGKGRYFSGSVTCNPKKPAWQGPQEWFLIKGALKDQLASIFESYPPSKVTILSLFSLINQMRKSEGAHPLIISKTTDDIAKRLVRSASILHNQKRFRVLSKFAKEADPTLEKTAETRVIAKNLNDLAQLIITSPSHRRMILNKDHNIVGIGIKKIADRSLAVIITGKVGRIVSAKK